MEDRLDVVSVRIEGEGGIIARMIGPFSRLAVVASAIGERRGMEGLNGLPVAGLEREVDPDTGPSARSTHNSSQAKCLGLSEENSRPTAFRTAR